MEPKDIPQEVVDAFKEAWESERNKIGRGIAPEGAKTRAGLAAAFNLFNQEKINRLRKNRQILNAQRKKALERD